MENGVYKEFLELVGFGDAPWDQEMDEMLPKWKYAAKKLGLTEKDHKFAVKEWIPKNYDVTKEGVRKSLGLIIAEVADLAMASEYKKKGHKIVYGVLPAHSPFYTAMKKTDPEVDIYFPDAALVILMNPLFHKLNPLLEEAEAHGVRLGCRHCALNKTRYAALRKGIIPMPTASWIWGFVCDQAPQSDEFFKGYWNEDYPIIVSRIPHDQPAHKREFEDDERVKYLAAEMREGYEKTCEKIGIEVDNNAIMAALDDRLKYMMKYTQLMKQEASDPPPFGGDIAMMSLMPMFLGFNTEYKYGNEALACMLRDGKESIDKGEGVVPKGSPNIMAWFIPFCNPWIIRRFEENGVAMSYCEGILASKSELQIPKYFEAFEANAEMFLKWDQEQNWGIKVDWSVEKMETYNIDAMVWGFMDFDRWLGSDHKICSRVVEEKSGKPCFYIEGDIYEDRDYSEEALRTRIETVCEVIKARVGTKGK